MLHSLLPHADLNRGFDAFPNHSKNYGWQEEHNAHVWVFDPSSEDGTGQPIRVDRHMTGSLVLPTAPTLARLYIEWSANVAATGPQHGVRWQFAYKVVRGENVASLDVDLDAGFTEAFTQLDHPAPATARFRRYRQVDLTVANLQKGDRVFWKLRRRGSVDTMIEPALLFGLFFDDGL